MFHSDDPIRFETVEQLVQQLRISKRELARAIGLPPDAIARRARPLSQRAQRRLQQTLVALKWVQPWQGSTSAAWSWYRSHPIPALGGLTASQLVSNERGDQVLAYLGAIAEGGYA